MPPVPRKPLEMIRPGTLDYVIVACAGPGETPKTEPVATFYYGPAVKRALRMGLVDEVSQAVTEDGLITTVRLTTDGVLYLGGLMHEIQVALMVESFPKKEAGDGE